MPYNFVPDSFHTGVTAEALRAKIDRKLAISLQRDLLNPKFQVEGVAPTNHFCTDTYYLAQSILYNLVADSFHTKNFAADFLQAKCDFRRKTAVLRF